MAPDGAALVAAGVVALAVGSAAGLGAGFSAAVLLPSFAALGAGAGVTGSEGVCCTGATTAGAWRLLSYACENCLQAPDDILRSGSAQAQLP